MDTPIETIEYRGYEIEIHIDTCSEDPRDAWDNITTMICFHKHYSLGDKHDYRSDDYNSWDEVEAQIVRDFNPVIIQRLFLYDHSMLSISTRSWVGRAHHAEWDSGVVGFVFITRKSVQDFIGWKRITKERMKKLEEYLKGDVETYDSWLTGNVYGYVINDYGDHLNSCWGYYGDTKYVISEAKSEIDYHINYLRKKHLDRLKTWIRNRVPLQNRTPLQLAL